MFYKEVGKVRHLKRNWKYSFNWDLIFSANNVKQVLVLFVEGCDGNIISKVELQMNSDVVLFEVSCLFKGAATSWNNTAVLNCVVMLEHMVSKCTLSRKLLMANRTCKGHSSRLWTN